MVYVGVGVGVGEGGIVAVVYVGIVLEGPGLVEMSVGLMVGGISSIIK